MIEAQERSASSQPSGRSGEEGQAAISIVLILGLFLLGLLGFAADLTNLWFHHQRAVAAADASCQAGAMDMLEGVNGVSYSSGSAGTTSNSAFTVGTSGDCSTANSNVSICFYANQNGYNGTGLSTTAESNDVSWTFPSSVSGVSGFGSSSFLQVKVAENVRTYFMPLVTMHHFQTVGAVSTCGLAQVKGQAPMVVLDPSGSGAMTLTGGVKLQIVGGPTRGIQVNSSSPTAISMAVSSNLIIDLSKGGPNSTGSSLAVGGGPTWAQIQGNGQANQFLGGTTPGQWISGASPIGDPFASVPVPAGMKNQAPSLGTGGLRVDQGVDGCPDSNKCYEFSPGYYPNGISSPTNYQTLIFQPGVYFMNGGLTVGNSASLRMAKPSGYKQTDGVMFYFLKGSFSVSGCSGCVNSNVSKVALTDLTCDGSLPPSYLNLPSAGLDGNVLYGMCTTNGTYVDSANDNPSDSVSSTGTRGILFFQDPSNTTSPNFAGSGALQYLGSLYFPKATLVMSGGTSTGNFILGQIVAYRLNMSGSAAIQLVLTQAPSVYMGKAAMF